MKSNSNLTKQKYRVYRNMTMKEKLEHSEKYNLSLDTQYWNNVPLWRTAEDKFYHELTYLQQQSIDQGDSFVLE